MAVRILDDFWVDGGSPAVRREVVRQSVSRVADDPADRLVLRDGRGREMLGYRLARMGAEELAWVRWMALVERGLIGGPA